MDLLIKGDLSGIKDIHLKEINNLFNMQYPPASLFTFEGGINLLGISKKLNREIAIFINRHGKVIDVVVGSLHQVTIPEEHFRGRIKHLSGVKCIHTHPAGTSILSPEDISVLEAYRVDAMVAISDRGGQGAEFSYGVIVNDVYRKVSTSEVYGPFPLRKIEEIHINDLLEKTEQGYMLPERKHETAVLVGIQLPDSDMPSTDYSLLELRRLSETAGVDVVDVLVQKKNRPDPAYYLGYGKAQELRRLCQIRNPSMVVIDQELSPSQQRNLEDILQRKVIDRTNLILDIFAQRARTREGKLQVELAQLKYHLPRLTGLGIELSRLGGGIGTRGPGETKLETDRRRIRKRIRYLEQQIELIRCQRTQQKGSREGKGYPVVALVGYTNAGKSTLLNVLTGSDVFTEDKLFATLDPTVRKIALPGGQEVLLIDTVGFIQKLPHTLVAAFRATLEEVKEADLLLHVLDVSHREVVLQKKAVESVLEEIGATHNPLILVMNKADQLKDDLILQELQREEKNSVLISAKGAVNINGLLQMIEKLLYRENIPASYLVPYSESALISVLYNNGTVIRQNYRDDGIAIQVLLDKKWSKSFKQYEFNWEE